MLQPSVERPIKFETLVTNLSEHDLRSNLTTRTLLDKALGLLPTRRVATYHAVNGQPYKGRLLDALTRMRVLDADSVRGLKEDKLRIPNIDQLAVSRQPHQLIRGLTKQNLGIWPIPEGVEFGDLNIRRLGMDLSQGQRDFLEQNQGVATQPSGLWIDGRRLMRDVSPLEGAYLPTAPEILVALLLYKTQEGIYPDSRGNWFLTGSRATLSLKGAYERAFVESEAKNLFIEACIQTSEHQPMIRRHLAILGDLSTTENNARLQVDHSGNKYTVTDAWSNRGVEFSIAGNDYADVLLEKGRIRLLLEKGKVTVRDIWSNKGIMYQSPYETVLREINRQRQLGQTFWDRTLNLPIVLSVDPKTGVKVGLLDNVEKQNTNWDLVGGYLRLDCWSALRRDIDQKTSGLEIVSQAFWPMIIPDSLADQLPRR